ncbi:hypothetical protein RRG08_064068 [Elysia crispata]|uniref:Uncharacterized protein n=1 Tax=Elysia crispata TaxID=231223 RepID=A0AAE1CY65_9GAST|nr:hypothetical protein RRG08_064068 [Elysia crispata]
MQRGIKAFEADMPEELVLMTRPEHYMKTQSDIVVDRVGLLQTSERRHGLKSPGKITISIFRTFIRDNQLSSGYEPLHRLVSRGTRTP